MNLCVTLCDFCISTFRFIPSLIAVTDRVEFAA